MPGIVISRKGPPGGRPFFRVVFGAICGVVSTFSSERTTYGVIPVPKREFYFSFLRWPVASQTKRMDTHGFHPFGNPVSFIPPAISVFTSLRTGLILKAGGSARAEMRASGKFEFFCTAADATSVGLASGAGCGPETACAKTDSTRQIAGFALPLFPVEFALALRPWR